MQVLIEIGAYFYLLAKTIEEAKEEGNYALKILKDNQFDWPIFYNMQSNEALSGNIKEKLIIFVMFYKK